MTPQEQIEELQRQNQALREALESISAYVSKVWTSGEHSLEVGKILSLCVVSPTAGRDYIHKRELGLYTKGLKDAAEIAAKQAAEDALAADASTDIETRLNCLAQHERALAIEKAIITKTI